jgi:hypothetical protein
MKKFLIVFILGIASAISFATEKIFEDDHGGHGGPVRIQQGHYTGYIKVDDQNQKFALQADFYLESPEDLIQFPRLNTILKINLGGYNTPEYVTQIYKNVRYDFDNNVLTLDEPSNDLVVSAQVHSMNGRTHLQGTVWIRSAAKNAKLILASESDEPGDPLEVGNPNDDSVPFAPSLAGQYQGQCEGKKAVFQIQTTRGLRNQDSRDGKFLFDYEIVANLGYWRRDATMSDKRPWSVYSSYAGGIYSFFIGKLLFLGPSTTAIDCKLVDGKLKCEYQSRDKKVPCEFELKNRNIQKAIKYQRQFHLNPTNEQLRDLPSASPPSNEALTKALGGHFIGFLHHEAYDRYQPVAIHVVPSSSTENPHNPNNIFVSTTSVLYFGRTPSDLFITQRYEPRSFYLRPGFTLSAPGTDSFIVIEEWKSGFIRGSWFSNGFGRVGTIELIKENTVTLPSMAKIVQPWQGEFRGAAFTLNEKIYRWFSVIFPNQPAEKIDSTVLYVGSYMNGTTIGMIKPMNRGRYDPYTGALGWLFSENNGIGMVSGLVEDDGSLSMYWPPSPNLFLATMSDYKLEPFKPVK